MNASEEEWKEMLYNSVECELCNEPYSDSVHHTPRLLSCGHTFCHFCLNGWAVSGSSSASVENAIQCPSCRRETIIGPEGLPKNFEVLRIREELEQWTNERLAAFRAQSEKVIGEKEKLALEAEKTAQIAQQEAAQAAEHAQQLQQQVAINTREKQNAIAAAETAHARAIQAVVRAEELQNETEILKRQVEWDAVQLQQVKKDASSAAAIAADLQSKANALQEQVDRVKSQLSLHSGKHDPTRMVVLVCEPITVGSWLLPYTRYTVICIANENDQMDSMRAAKEWICKPNQVPFIRSQLASVKVYRRYSDFIWLHEALCNGYPGLFVPFLPGKHFFKNNSDFVSDRMRSLQAFLREILRNPVLSRSDATRSFLLLSTEELEKYKAKMEPIPDVVLSTAKSPPSSSRTASWLAPATSQWAWGAMTKLTTKLATKAGLQTIEEPQLDGEQAWFTLRRKSYQQLCLMYQTTAEKGGHVLKLERKQARDWIHLAHGLEEMGRLENAPSKLARDMIHFGYIWKNIPDIAEHATQETLRMQMLHLGSIEEGFERINEKEKNLNELNELLIQENETIRNEELNNKINKSKMELNDLKNSITNELKQLEPQRSLFLFKCLLKSCQDIYQITMESRQEWEGIRNRLLDKE